MQSTEGKTDFDQGKPERMFVTLTHKAVGDSKKRRLAAYRYESEDLLDKFTPCFLRRRAIAAGRLERSLESDWSRLSAPHGRHSSCRATGQEVARRASIERNHRRLCGRAVVGKH